MSNDERFDWDDGNRDHLTECEEYEAEEALLDPNQVSAPAYNTRTERRWATIGATEDSGAILYVVFTLRPEKTRVVTCREATEREKRRYRNRGK